MIISVRRLPNNCHIGRFNRQSGFSIHDIATALANIRCLATSSLARGNLSRILPVQQMDALSTLCRLRNVHLQVLHLRPVEAKNGPLLIIPPMASIRIATNDTSTLNRQFTSVHPLLAPLVPVDTTTHQSDAIIEFWLVKQPTPVLSFSIRVLVHLASVRSLQMTSPL